MPEPKYFPARQQLIREQVLVPKAKPPQDQPMADIFYDRLQRKIKDAERRVAEDEDLFVCYHCPNGETIVIERIGYYNPSLVELAGRDLNGDVCSVLAHMSSVSLVLKFQKRVQDSPEPKRLIGFHVEGEAS